jgi:transposase
VQRAWLAAAAGGKQRSEKMHVLVRVRSLRNLECVGETLWAALNDLAQLSPDWLVQQISLDWFERSSHRVENYRLPKAEAEHSTLAEQIGADGLHLLAVLQRKDSASPVCRCCDKYGSNILRWQQGGRSGGQGRRLWQEKG